MRRLTRRHFEAIAAAFAGESFADKRRVCAAVAEALAQFSPGFDRDRFMGACDIPIPSREEQERLFNG